MGSAVGAPNGAAAAGDHMPLGSVVIDMRVPPAKKTESRLSRCWKVRKESLGAPRQQHWCWRGLLRHVLLLLFTDTQLPGAGAGCPWLAGFTVNI